MKTSNSMFAKSVLSKYLAPAIAAVVVGCVAMSANNVHAAQENSATSSPATKSQALLVSDVSHNALTVDAQFKGPAPSLVGILAHDATGRKVVVWVESGKYVVAGDVFDASGQSLTRKAEERFGIVPKTFSPSILAKEAMSATGFVIGHAGPLIVAFEDPNCSYCHKFSQDTQAMVEAGKLRIRVIPVAFVKPDSAGKAQAIVQAASSAQSWIANEAKFDDLHEEGAIAPATVRDPKVMSELQSNNTLLAHSGQYGTPTLVFCAKGGNRYSPVVSHGASPEVLRQLAKVSTLEAGGVCAQQ